MRGKSTNRPENGHEPEHDRRASTPNARNRSVEEREARGTRQRSTTWQTENARGEVSVPAIRHIGPTLESDPRYLELVGSGGPTPEAEIAEGMTAAPDLRELAEKGIDPRSGREIETGKATPLKTRLPGDTSSDPHTDVTPAETGQVGQAERTDQAGRKRKPERRSRKAA